MQIGNHFNDDRVYQKWKTYKHPGMCTQEELKAFV